MYWQIARFGNNTQIATKRHLVAASSKLSLKYVEKSRAEN